MLKGVLADANIVGHVDLVMAVVRAAGWIDLGDELAIRYAHFPDVGLDADATDAAIWQLCQREQYDLTSHFPLTNFDTLAALPEQGPRVRRGCLAVAF
jgi:hypothetical protein